MKTVTTDQGHPGTWPNGEPQCVRDAYDQLLAKQTATPAQRPPKGGKQQ